LREVLKEHPLVLVEAPRLTEDQLLGVAAGLGHPLTSPREDFRLDAHPKIMRVGNPRDSRGKVVGANAIPFGFHSDNSFRKRPAEFTMLHARQVPERGGSTQFSSLYRLYEELDDATREAWSLLEVEHESPSALYAEDADRSAVHPLVSSHPDSGRKLVFASPYYARRIVGRSEAESQAILKRIAEAVERPDADHRWTTNDLLVWDNRAVVHRATEYDRSEARLLWRVSVRSPY
jgi:taurine dioxygenase